MPELVKSSLPVFYTVCMKKYNSLTQFHGLLYSVRRDFFEYSRKSRDRVTDFTDGVETHYSYWMFSKKLNWKSKSGHRVLELSVPQPDGYCILSWNLVGNLVSKTSYDKNHLWVKTIYFANDNEVHPQIRLEPLTDCNDICMQEYDAELKKYRKTLLYGCPISIGTTQQSIINSAVGEPQIYAATSQGDFCYCTQQELTLREKINEELNSGSRSTQPKWTVPKPMLEPLVEPVPMQQPKPVTEPENPVHPVDALSKRCYAADHELYHVDAEPTPHSNTGRYTVAMKKMHGPVVHNKNLLAKNERNNENEKAEEPPGVNPIELMGTATCIVISAQESYLYFGQVIEGLRQGRGRTQMPSGTTAYEGGYHNDKRDGFGAYYYKSGKICYVGEWKENYRDGVGVSFRAADSGIHVGLWKDDKPIGTGSIFDSKGNLRYAGRIENGERQGVGVAYHADEGTVFVGKWKNNIPTGEGSAFDRSGNLIYTGMWKNGKRHGQGTEYAPNGSIVFEGEWHEDSYFEGTLYRRLEQKHAEENKN